MPRSPAAELRAAAEVVLRGQYKVWLLRALLIRGLTTPSMTSNMRSAAERHRLERSTIEARLREAQRSLQPAATLFSRAIRKFSGTLSEARAIVEAHIRDIEVAVRDKAQSRVDRAATHGPARATGGPRPPRGDPPWVIDLSSRRLTPSMVRLLRRGLLFVPSKPPRDDDWIQVIASLDQVFEKAISAYHRQVARHTSDPARCSPPTYGLKDIEDCRYKVAATLLRFRPMNTPNLPPDEAEALEELRSDKGVVLLPADKGGAVVCLDVTDYLDACLRTLPTREPVAVKPEDALATEMVEVREILNAMGAPAACSPEPGSRLAYAYCLPKVHKVGCSPSERIEFLGALSWRPVISSVTAPTANLQRWMTKVLYPIYMGMAPEHISDPLDVVSRGLCVSEGEQLISLDVVNMFGTVPVDETVALVLSLWTDKHTAEHGVSRDGLGRMLRLVTRPLFVAPDGAVYRQERGFPMGGPASPVLCMIYVSDLMRRSGVRAAWMLRYVDDVLACLQSGYTPLQAIDDLCRADVTGSVAWTCELPGTHRPAPPCPRSLVDGAIPFLDLLAVCPGDARPRALGFLPYRKPCAVSRVMHRASAVEETHRRAWAMSKLDRHARLHCKGARDLAVDEMRPELRSLASRHGYSPGWVASVFRNFLSRDEKADLQGALFVTLPPWLPISVLRAQFVSIGVRVATSGRPSSVGALFNARRRAPHVGGPVVYAYRCRTCGAVYVGETCDPGRRHMAHDYAGSRVAAHSAAHPQHVFDTPVVLARPFQRAERLVFECIYGRSVPERRSINAADAEFDPGASEAERTRSGALKRLHPSLWMLVVDRGLLGRAWRRICVAVGETVVAAPSRTCRKGLPPLPPFPDTLAELLPLPSPPPRAPVPRLAAVVHEAERPSCCSWCRQPFSCGVRCTLCVNYLCIVCAGGIKSYVCPGHGDTHVIDGVACRSVCALCPAVVPPALDAVLCEESGCPEVVCRRCLRGASDWWCPRHGCRDNGNPQPPPSLVSRRPPRGDARPPRTPLAMSASRRLPRGSARPPGTPVALLLLSPMPVPLTFHESSTGCFDDAARRARPLAIAAPSVEVYTFVWPRLPSAVIVQGVLPTADCPSPSAPLLLILPPPAPPPVSASGPMVAGCGSLSHQKRSRSGLPSPVLRCGDAGGRTRAGAACRMVVRARGRRCHVHEFAPGMHPSPPPPGPPPLPPSSPFVSRPRGPVRVPVLRPPPRLSLVDGEPGRVGDPLVYVVSPPPPPLPPEVVGVAAPPPLCPRYSCGAAGGRTRGGAPCRRLVLPYGSRCHQHPLPCQRHPLPLPPASPPPGFGVGSFPPVSPPSPSLSPPPRSAARPADSIAAGAHPRPVTPQPGLPRRGLRRMRHCNSDSPPLYTPPRAFMARLPAASPVAPLHVVGNRAGVCRSVFGLLPPMLLPGRPRRDLFKVTCCHPQHDHLWSSGARIGTSIKSPMPGKCLRGLCRFCCYVTSFYSDGGGVAPCDYHGAYPRAFASRMPRPPGDIRRV